MQSKELSRRELSMQKSSTQGLSKVGFHGNLLMIAAGIYKTLPASIMETVQNALGMGATWVRILIDRKNKSIEITDNGGGIQKSEFDASMLQWGQTINTRKDSMSKWNLGLKSFLNKCKSFSFTSSKRGSQDYFEWTFICKDIQKLTSLEQLQIPWKMVDNIRFSPRADVLNKRSEGYAYVPWRSRVYIENYTADTLMGKLDIDELKEDIQSRFTVKMRDLGAIVYITDISEDGKETYREVTAIHVVGHRLKAESFPRNVSNSETLVDLYYVPQRIRSRQSKIFLGVMGDSHRIDETKFVFSLRGANLINELGEDAARALQSGYFNGQILTRSVKFDPNRVGFQQDENLLQFLWHIRDWYKEVGVGLISEAEEDTKVTRHEKIADKVLQWLERDLLKQPEWQNILKTFTIGTIGEGHFRDGKKELGETDNPEKVTGTSDLEKDDKEKKKKKEIKVKEEPKKDKPGHNPFTIVGGKKKRALVRGHSTGLSIEVGPLFGLDKTYSFDKTRGQIFVNSAHPLFTKCDEASESASGRYIQFVAMEALTLHMLSDDIYDSSQLVLNDLLKMEVCRIVDGDSYLRKPKKKS